MRPGRYDRVMSAVDDVRDEFTAFWGQMAVFWGIPPSTARVHAWLLAQADPQDAEAIASGLSVSRGAVSMALRDLRDWGLVVEQRAPGERRTAYAPETDPERLVRSVVQNRRRREWTPILERVDGWLPRLASERGADSAAFKGRLERLAGLVRTADGLAEEFLRGGTLRSLGLRLLVARALKRAR
jgi:DNA-binding transcriptional regulator GbsR (MarR family)